MKKATASVSTALPTIEAGTKSDANPHGIGFNPTYGMNTETAPMPLYVIPMWEDGKVSGYTTLGYDYAKQQVEKLSRELAPWLCNQKNNPTSRYLTLAEVGENPLALYALYQGLMRSGRERNAATGWRSKVGLTKQLVGLEGAVVEVVDCYDERRTFIVGKSGGWMPCHLELESDREDGGGAVTGAPFKNVRVIRAAR